jgi:alpha-1,2-mannosyltransferase
VAGGRTLLETSVQGPATVRVPLTGAALRRGDLDVLLISPAWTTRRDPRPLGVAVERVTWTPLGWTWPPARQLWTVPALSAVLAALALALGRSVRAAAGGAAAVGVLVAVASACRPLELAPYSHRLLAFAIAWYAPLLLCCLLLREAGHAPWRLPPLSGPAALTLITFGGFWSQWAFHAFLCRDSAGAFCPPGRVSFAGTATFVALGAVAMVSRSGTRLRLASICVALAAAAHGLMAAASAFRRPAVDFETLWIAARAVAAGQSPYRVGEVLQNHFGAVFKAPPFYGVAFLPFASLDLGPALFVYRALTAALYVGCGALLMRLLRGRLDPRLALTAVVVVMGLMQPAFDTMAYGQIDVVLLTLITAALLGTCLNRPALTGFGIASAALLKVYPLLLVGHAVARREGRVVAWTAAWLALLTGVAAAVAGWDVHVVYFTEVLPRIAGGTGWIENQTINGFACRLLTGQVVAVPQRSSALDAVTYGGFLGVAALTAVAAWKAQGPSSARRAMQFGVFVVATLVAVPAAWIHYSTITVLAFVLLIRDGAERPFSPGSAFATAVAFGLVAYGNQWAFYDGSPQVGLTLLALSLKLYGLVALWVVMLGRAWTEAKSSSPPGAAGTSPQPRQ